MAVTDYAGERPRPTFGGHEKFAFRHTWLKKGFELIQADPEAFAAKEVFVDLGVGKNMATAIRHWCLALGVVEERHVEGRSRPLVPSDFGRALLADKGWDPYLEAQGTLWLLHWQLATDWSRGIVWRLAFATPHVEFSKQLLEALVERRFEQLEIKTTPKMIEREIDCVLRTYLPSLRSQKRGIAEETLECPLIDLDLMRYSAEDNVYRFNIGEKPSLPDEIFGYALLSYLADRLATRRTIALDECIYQEGSPGQVFKLDENSVVTYVEALTELTDGQIRFQESAGLRQLYLPDMAPAQMQAQGEALLSHYYG